MALLGSDHSQLKKMLNVLIAGGLTILVLAVLFGIFVAFNLNHMLDQLELKTYDLRAQMQWGGKAQKRPSPDIIILQFDDPSFKLLNDEYGEWPWPRDVHADMIEFLNRNGAKRILYDIMFVAHRKGGEAADAKLIEAFHKNNNVYISMNFDNELADSQKLGKDLTPRDIELLKPLSIPVQSDLSQSKNSTLKLKADPDGTLFFDNDHMTFNHFRSILPELLSKKSNVAIINHGADVDGVSRGNPLIFRFQYQPFIKTALPFKKVGAIWQDSQGRRTDADGYLLARSKFLPAIRQKDGTYIDRDPDMPRRTDKDGYLMDDYGHFLYQREPRLSSLFFPYLGLRVILDMKFPKEKQKIQITRDGHLRFPGYDIPLRPNGDFLVNWYNTNVQWEEYRQNISDLSGFREKAQARIASLETSLRQATRADVIKKTKAELEAQRKELRKIDELLALFRRDINGGYTPQPYRMVSAWEVIRTMNKERDGKPLNEEDMALKRLLKDKVIFIGATAMAAYDIKNTPISSTLPGVIVQASIFDNLYQNKGDFVRSLSPSANLLLMAFICLLAAVCTFKMRNALAGMLTVANIGILYILFAILLFHHAQLWANIAMPLSALVVTTTITFMVKYVLRDKDYEKTYALATTDSMTGLYNHRFFQEHMRRSIEQASRYKHKFSLLLIDIDFFKKFNDTYGHQAGDEVLRHVARKLTKSVRTVDVVARYGGEEMAIILERTNEEEALAIARKVVLAIAEEAYPIAEGVSKHVTISCGVATYPTHGEDPSQLIEFADAGLYRAKKNGRNQVGAQTDDEPPRLPEA
jgi:diguanylate cyclase (GGDEF)-like protein